MSEDPNISATNAELLEQALSHPPLSPPNNLGREAIAGAASEILTRRAILGRLDGYTLQTGYEIADAILALSPAPVLQKQELTASGAESAPTEDRSTEREGHLDHGALIDALWAEFYTEHADRGGSSSGFVQRCNRVAAALSSPTPPRNSGEPGGSEGGEVLCSDCPPVGYPTDKTRCTPCPRQAPPPPLAKGEAEEEGEG